ncbi:MAG: dUTP diphosphatase [Candidatus Aminicenantes bacterium]|nr:dUTP diphosphatase [Candidatus Aminicenantes bacterium]RLE03867.1 MAG: dUTP diphosphatase [Candidatus Aminicenantes bacterium]HHF43329.1 dUTP diphosphatase [Candidatus Aminicenantes bacterium]
MEVRIKKIHPQARLPQYSHAGDAGLDLYSVVDETIAPGERKAIPTGIKMAIPPGYVGLIWDKSGLSLEGIHRLAGVVDAGYRGEVKVVLVNLGSQEFRIAVGMKIAQMLIQPVETVKIVETSELDPTSRGEGGFGSTGRF